MRIPKNKFLLLIIVLACHILVQAQNQNPVAIEYKSAGYTFKLSGDLKGFKSDFSFKTDNSGLQYLTLRLKTAEKITPLPLLLSWSIPVVDIQETWTPARNFGKTLNADWQKDMKFLSGSTTSAPVTTFYNFNNQNRFTFACSDALNCLRLGSGVNESTAMLDCEVQLFTGPQATINTYELTLRLDKRDVPYWQTLKEVAQWWEKMPAYKANISPDAARLPMYSTWYSFHQKLEPKAVEEQCRLAKSLGCETVIEDDGWQTLDSNRGYAYTGDWNPDRIPKMKAHVDKVHQLGMKFMLWYSVPFVGEKSKIYPKFVGKYLYYNKGWRAYVLDARFPEVRQYLIDKYVTALKEWGLDGFKLDFVDSFAPDATSEQQATDGRDFASTYDAVDKLLYDVMTQLRAIKPDIMIEFRQSYVGPLMRKYGNMFRAADAPNDALSNRVRTTDVHLLSGSTAVHSDMLMWNNNEKTETAALQFLNILFSVPQISVKIDELPADQKAMLGFWLSFWRSNRDVILDGNFLPENPDQNYPLISAINADKQLIAVYASQKIVAIKGKMRKNVVIVNANHGNRIVLQLEEAAGIKTIEVLDCKGKLVNTQKKELGKGLQLIEVPASGLIKIN